MAQNKQDKECIWKQLETGFIKFTDCCLLFKPETKLKDK